MIGTEMEMGGLDRYLTSTGVYVHICTQLIYATIDLEASP